MATPRPIQLRATGSRQEERTNSCTLGLQPLGSSRLPPVAGLAARSGPKLHPQVPVQVALQPRCGGCPRFSRKPLEHVLQVTAKQRHPKTEQEPWRKEIISDI